MTTDPAPTPTPPPPQAVNPWSSAVSRPSPHTPFRGTDAAKVTAAYAMEASTLRTKLAASVEHEHQLLQECSTAEADAWRGALTEAIARVDLAVVEAPGRDLPGLASARRVLLGIGAAHAPVPALHRLDVDVDAQWDVAEWTVHCYAPAGAPCRTTHACSPPYCGDGACVGADSPVVADTGSCAAAAYFTAQPLQIPIAYTGPRRPLRPGGIDVRDDDGYWEWRYAGDHADGWWPAPCPTE
jgi:hypothetical protein